MDRYVVFWVDPDTREVSFGDIATTKAHAQRWANLNQKNCGGIWGIAPEAEALRYKPKQG